MIDTSYFANLRNLPDNIVPISICTKSPTWYTGLEYKPLAPGYGIMLIWKKDRDLERFRSAYIENSLDRLEPIHVLLECNSMLDNDTQDICIICYEKPDDVCHRHFVSQWLRNNGFQCEEWGNCN